MKNYFKKSYTREYENLERSNGSKNSRRPKNNPSF
jgi:hypothetical protein